MLSLLSDLSDHIADDLHHDGTGALRQSLGKLLLVVRIVLEDVQLEPGAAMRFGRLQALFYHKYTDKNRFLDKVAAAEGIDACRDKSSDIK